MVNLKRKQRIQFKYIFFFWQTIKKFELQLLLCNILYQTLHMKLFMHLLYARSATIGHEVICHHTH